MKALVLQEEEAVFKDVVWKLLVATEQTKVPDLLHLEVTNIALPLQRATRHICIQVQNFHLLYPRIEDFHVSLHNTSYNKGLSSSSKEHYDVLDDKYAFPLMPCFYKVNNALTAFTYMMMMTS